MKIIKVTFLFFMFGVILAKEKAPCDDSRTKGGNADGTKCSFPFEYGGKTYDKCTNSNHAEFWCATSSNYANDQKWGECIIDECTTPSCPITTDPTDTGSAAGETCVFPFIYEGKNYFNCIQSGKLPETKSPWCATSSNYDLDSKWGICQIDTVESNLCVFPFTYRGVTYHNCTRRSSSGSYNQNFWCGTRAEVDDITSTDDWGYCNFNGLKVLACATEAPPTDTDTSPYYNRDKCSPPDMITTTGGNDQDDNEPNCACGFPFTFEGTNYDDCTTDTADPDRKWPEPWCSCVANEDFKESRKWGVCTGCTKETRGCTTKTVNAFKATGAEDSPCVFPFIYKKYKIAACTKIRWDAPWCATTNDFDKDRLWRNCGEQICQKTTTTAEPTTKKATTQAPTPKICYEKTERYFTPGGKLLKGVSTEEECKEACNADDLCKMIDFNRKNAITDRCFYHTSMKQRFSAQFIDQFVKQPCDKEAPADSKCFELARRYMQFGGTRMTSTTVDDCIEECKNDGTCAGFDYNLLMRNCFKHTAINNPVRPNDDMKIDQYKRLSEAGCAAPAQ